MKACQIPAGQSFMKTLPVKLQSIMVKVYREFIKSFSLISLTIEKGK